MKTNANFGILVILMVAALYGATMIGLEYSDIAPAEKENIVIFSVIGFIILVLILVKLLVYPKSMDANSLLQNGGVQGEAEIINIEDTGVSAGDIKYIVRLTVRITSQTQPPFETSLETLVSRVKIPHIGDKFAVVFDPMDHRQIALFS
ncbi:MAG: hypothetical protein HY817_02190 [Candidatus Abawacabacteria bacterium]|nr:hypothetical protein [Candidatus Abawacabacteria bacterium]